MEMTVMLKRLLLLDSIGCLAMGSGLALAAASLSAAAGLDSKILLGAGLLLLPVGLYICWVAMRQRVAPLFVHAIIAGNLLWVAESVIVAGTAGITTMGTVLVLGQAAAVAAVTLLESRALARALRSPARAGALL